MRNKFISIVILVAAVATTHAQTLLQRFDMSRGGKPYHTSALFLKGGWEIWTFGDTDRELLDVELGRTVWSEGSWSAAAYAVNWPASGKWFVIPWLTYTGKLAGGSLSLNLAYYQPINGGPHILLSDMSSLVWRDRQGRGFGLSASYWGQDGLPATLRVGPQAEFSLGNTMFRLSYHPTFLVGDGEAVGRIELVQRL